MLNTLLIFYENGKYKFDVVEIGKYIGQDMLPFPLATMPNM